MLIVFIKSVSQAFAKYKKKTFSLKAWDDLMNNFLTGDEILIIMIQLQFIFYAAVRYARQLIDALQEKNSPFEFTLKVLKKIEWIKFTSVAFFISKG